MISRIFWLTTSLAIMLLSCSQPEKSGTVELDEDPGEESSNSAIVILSREQFNTLNLELDEPREVTFSAAIHSNGFLEPLPSGSARVSTQISGRVSHILHQVGETVTRGEVLYRMESQELIELQQQFAEASHKLRKLKSDYERIRTLTDEKVLAGKELLEAEAGYLTAQAMVEGLKARLALMDRSLWNADKGEITPSLSVRAPISGMIVAQELEIGQFLETGDEVMELVDLERLQLRLQIFEKDLGKVELGQKVRFRVQGGNQSCQATITRIARSIHEETRAIPVIASIDRGCGLLLANHQFVETEILTSVREVRAVPEEAVVKENGRYFIFAVAGETEEEITFRKVEVQTGETHNGFVEILDTELNKLLWRGAYYLVSEQ